MKCYFFGNRECDNECLWNGIGKPGGYADEDCSHKQSKDMNANYFKLLTPFWMTIATLILVYILASLF